MYFKSLKIGDEFFWRSRVSARVGGSMLLLKKVSATRAKEIELWRETSLGSNLEISPYARVESAQHILHHTSGRRGSKKSKLVVPAAGKA